MLQKNTQYTSIAPRVIIIPMPAEFDSWGYNEKGEQWQHSLCMMDDFGNAVPHDAFAYPLQELMPYLSPDFNFENPPADWCELKYPYILHTPMPH